MEKRSLTLILLTTLVLLTSVAAILWQLHRHSPFKSTQGFIQQHSTVTNYDIMDVGIVDVNNDGNLDIYTVNHSAKQNLLVANAAGDYQDLFAQLNLSQDYAFAYLEDSNQPPEIDAPGYYIYRQSRQLILKAHNTDSLPPLEGTLTVPWRIQIEKAGDPRFNVTEQALPGKQPISVMSFTLSDGDSLSINGIYNINELPHEMDVNSSFPLEYVMIGHAMLTPVAHKFELNWRDRHSMLWTDMDFDGDLDLFVARGGVRGMIGEVSADIHDEWFEQTQHTFDNLPIPAGIRKGNCPARQSSWVDVDSDNDLDLHIVCGRGFSHEFPNLLFRYESNGEYVEIAEQLGLNFGGISVNQWLDADADNDVDLLAIEDKQLVFYENKDHEFIPEVLLSDLSTRFSRFSVSDYDLDGDLDAIAVSGTRTLFMKNASGKFLVITPDTLGLPQGGRSVNWVDYDNDGRPDLHIPPHGIFRQNKQHVFDSTALFKSSKEPTRLSDARCAWYDADNNGTRDVLCAEEWYPHKLIRIWKKLVQHQSETRYWTSWAYRNNNLSHHWLQIELTGEPSQRLPVNTKVIVKSDLGTHLQAVGNSDGAHFSQGHYRLYFGLGAQSTVKSVSVIWANGSQTTIKDVPVDQILKIPAPESQSAESGQDG